MRILSDRITQTEARIYRLEGGLSSLILMAEQHGEKLRQQRGRHLRAISAVRTAADSGIPESAF